MSVRVLIVDDQAPFRDAARAVVEATDGFDVIGESSTGEASVDATRQLKPDLVLMDVNLPTYDEEDYASKAAECGASAYIAKSRFDPDRLTAAWATATKPSVNSSHDPGP